MRSLQEKFQISPVLNQKENQFSDKWVKWVPGTTAPALGKARKSQESVGDWSAKCADDVDFRRFNEMPPGMDINQARADIEKMPLVMMDETSVSKSTNPESLREGFKRLDMKGTDDQYTGEHMDLFYGDAGGFVERNNYCDRE